jgi:hypothetical protein
VAPICSVSFMCILHCVFSDLVNEFHRFCGTDEVLEWDEFWRFMKDLELGVSDLEIAQMRQKADVNKDGVLRYNTACSYTKHICICFHERS